MPNDDINFGELYEKLMKLHEEGLSNKEILANFSSTKTDPNSKSYMTIDSINAIKEIMDGSQKKSYIGKLAIPVQPKDDTKVVVINGQEHRLSATEWHYLKSKMHAENYGMKPEKFTESMGVTTEVIQKVQAELMAKQHDEWMAKLKLSFYSGYAQDKQEEQDEMIKKDFSLPKPSPGMGKTEFFNAKQGFCPPLPFTVRVVDDHNKCIGKMKINVDRRHEVWRDGKGREMPFEKMETAHLFFAVRMLYNKCAPSDHLCHKSYKGKERYAPREQRRLDSLKIMERMMTIWASRDDVLDSQCDEMEFMVANVKKYF